MKYYWIDFIDDFLYEKLVNEWLSPKTIDCYKTVLNSLFTNPYVEAEDFKTYTEMNFKRMLWDLLLKNNWSSHTYNRYRKELKTFCNYLIKKGHLKENPLKNIPMRKLAKTLPKCLNKKQVKELQYTIKNTFDTDDFLSVRNKTIFYFYMYTWCRLNEMVNLKIQDIDFINWSIRINNAKGQKDRIVPLTYTLSDYLISYLLKKKKSKINTEIVFPTRFCWFLQKRDVYNIVKKVREKLSFRFTPHMLRHTFATELISKNVNLYNLSKILWHSNIETTKIYLSLQNEDIRIDLNNKALYK